MYVYSENVPFQDLYLVSQFIDSLDILEIESLIFSALALL